MRRKIFATAIVFLIVSAVAAIAQETQPAQPRSVPAASRSQADCTGFIDSPNVSSDQFVVGGEDDDLHSVNRQYTIGNSVYLGSRGNAGFAVDSVYSVFRKAKDIFLTRRYSGQGGDIRRLGQPYEDVGRIRVTHVTPNGAVAKVEFACGGIVPGDFLMPFQLRPIPEYTLSSPLDHFMLLDDKKPHGMIIAAINNHGFVGQDYIVYLSLGQDTGAKLGQRFRVYKDLSTHAAGLGGSRRLPYETVGEAVVLSVQPRSSVAIVVQCYRDIAVGDSIEAE